MSRPAFIKSSFFAKALFGFGLAFAFQMFVLGAHTAAAPVVASVAPASGSTAGGNSIIITGTGFVSGDTVAVGGSLATGVVVVSATQITATTPAAASAGIVDVAVTEPSVGTSTLSGSYVYTDATYAAKTWVGTTSNVWTVGTNWSPSGAPSATDIAIIDGGSNSAVSWTLAAAQTIGGLTIAPSAASSLTLTGGSASNILTTAKEFVIGKLGNFTHAANTTTQANSIFLSVGTTFKVSAGGTVNLNNLGYSTGNGTGKGAAAKGAGYGGNGYGFDATNGKTYGDSKQPTDLGSGGTGFAGGGQIKVTTTDATIDGSITADSSGSTAVVYGSGGSVWINATGTVRGSGTVTASSTSTSSSTSAYSGGGGRIALYFGTNSFNGTIQALSKNANTTTSARTGGAGTIYYKQTSATNGDLVISNDASTSNPATGFTTQVASSLTYDSIKITGNTNYVVPSTYSLTVASTVSAATSSTTPGRVTINGTLNVPNNTTLTNYYIYKNGTYSDASPIIGAGSTIEQQDANSSTPWNVTSLTVNSGGNLTHKPNTTTETYLVNVAASGDVTINSGGSIDTSGAGYSSGNGPGKSTSTSRGAGYGGNGASFNATEGLTYGDPKQPVNIGSGGTCGAVSNGGGAIKLTAANVVNNGTVAADSAACVNASSAGSGGSIWVNVSASYSGNGTFSADSIANSSNTYVGGGGRIAIYYNTTSFSGTVHAYADGAGAGTLLRGGAGTIYYKQTSATNGDLVVSNDGARNNTIASGSSTQVGSSATYDTIKVTGNTTYVIPTGSTLTTSALTAATNASYLGRFQINGTLNVPNNTTLTNYYIYKNGTYSDASPIIGAGSTIEQQDANSSTPWNVTSLTVNSGGNLTHAANTTTETYTVNIAASGDIVINSGATVNVTNLGYNAGTGPGAGKLSVGGGYGGNGTNYTATNGLTYGDPKQPVNIGSGGNGGTGKGGGAVKLSAANLTLNGQISSNAIATVALTDLGSGGSVWLNASGVMSGSGVIQANSGPYSSANSGGGGGRIALYYGTRTFNGTVEAVSKEVNGSKTGGAGTIYYKAASATNGDLVVSNDSGASTNQGYTTQVSASQTYDSIRVSGNTNYVIPSGSTLTAASTVAAATSSASPGRIQDNGTLTIPSATTLTNYYIYKNGTFAPSNLTIGSGSTVELQDITPSSAWSINALTVASGGTLTQVIDGGTPTHSLNISASSGDVTVQTGGVITANGAGYGATLGSGGGAGTGSTYGGGGGYGGVGGNGTTGAAGGGVYGSSTAPTDWGSGGGGVTGGNGGGALKIVATGNVIVNGTVSANGANGTGTYGAGGSGGSVWLTGNDVSGTGTISAKGGNRASTNQGGGGGGRVAFTYNGTLTINSLTPNNGTVAGGDSVVVSGTGFSSRTGITFAASTATVSYVNSTTVNVTTPAGAAPGAVNVVATNPYFEGTVSVAGGTGINNGAAGTINPTNNTQTYTAPNAYTYNGAVPTVTNVSPNHGSVIGGTGVTITGTNFLTNPTVTFGGVAASGVTYVNATTITAIAPAHVAGAVDVVVTNTADNQSGTLVGGFTYNDPPSVSSVTPNAGTAAGGQSVTISGDHFMSSPTVTFGGSTATSVTYVNATTITAITPAHASGAVDVVVTNSDTQSGTLTNGYTYALAPTISSVTPDNGTVSGGTTITITGSNFAATPTVTVDGMAASGVTLVNSTTVTAVTPAHVAGVVNVVVTNPDSQSATRTNGYTYNDPPAISDFSPKVGVMQGGTTVTITGTNFTDHTTVKFDGVSAAISSHTSTSMTVTTPAGNLADVSVTVGDDGPTTNTASSTFRYAPDEYAFLNSPLAIRATQPGQMTIQARNASHNTVVATYDITIDLSSSSATGSFSADGSTYGTTSVVIPSGSSSVTFWYKDATKGTPTITATGLAGIEATQGATIKSRFALLVTGVSDPINAGTPSSVTVQAVDWQGNAENGYTGTLHFTSDDGFASLPADYQVVGSDSGHKTFVNGVTMVTNGDHCVTVADANDADINGEQCNITVQNGSYSTATKLAVITDPQSTPNNTATGVITIQVQDADGNPSPVPVDRTIYIDSDSVTGRFSPDGTSNWSATASVQYTIKANTTSVNVHYKDTVNGTHGLSMRDQASMTDTALTDTAQDVMVGVGPPAQLSITAPDNIAYGVWQRIDVYLQDMYGQNANNPTSPLSVYLTSDDGSTQYSLSSNGAGASTSLQTTMPVGANHIVAYVYRAGPATVSLAASDATPADGATGYDDGLHTVNFVSGSPSKLSLAANATVAAGQSLPVTISIRNAADELAVASTNKTINLDDLAGGGHFSLSSTSWSDTSAVTLPAGETTITVYYKNNTTGTVTLRGSTSFAAPVSDQTSVTVTAGSFAQFAFTAGPNNVPVTEGTAYTVTTEDMYGNVVPVSSNTNVYFYTTSATGAFATSANGPWTTTFTTISAGNTTATIYYRDTTLGATPTITASDQTPIDQPDGAITNATKALTVVGQTADKIAYTTSSQTVTAGQSSAAITIQMQKSNGSPAIMGSDTVVSLSSNSGGTHGFTATANPAAPSITQVTIPAGNSSATFYYHDTLAGAHTIQASSGPLQATQAITISADSATSLAFTTPAQTGVQNQPSGQMRVAITDAYGNEVNAGSDTILALSSSCGDGTFSFSSSPWSPVAQMTIAAGSSAGFFYFKTSQTSCLLTIQSTGLNDATQTYTAASGPVKLAFSSIPSSLEAGQSTSVQVSVEDVSGNLVAPGVDTDVYLAASSGNLSTSHVVISAGANTTSFTYTAGAAGTITLTARDESNATAPDTGLINASSDITVNAGAVAGIRLTPNNDSTNVNTSKQITVSLINAYGFVTNAIANTTVNLASTEPAGVFTATANLTDPAISSVVISTGSSSNTVYYHQPFTGQITVTASSGSLANGTAQYNVISTNLVSFRLSSNSSNTEAGQSKTITVQGLDEYGNVVIMPSGLHIFISTTSSTATISGTNYSASGHAITLSSDTTAATISYVDPVAGDYSVTASDAYPADSPDNGVVNDTLTFTVDAGAPAEIHFVQPPSSFERGGVSNQITFELRNAYHIETKATTPIQVDLSPSLSTGQMALSTSGPWTTRSITVPAGSSRGSFFYRNNVTLGLQTVTAASTGLSSASYGITVVAGAATQIAFKTPPQTLSAVHTSGVYTVEARNQFGYPTRLPSGSVVRLSSSSATGQFALKDPDWGVETIAWPETADSIDFYYRDKTAGTFTLTVSNAAVGDAKQQVVVTEQIFDHFLVTNISDPQKAGTPSSVVVIAQDKNNYTVGNYNGTIHFSSTDPRAQLPADYTFNPYTDKGTHTFTNGVVLGTTGEQTVTVQDIHTGVLGVQTAITVTDGEGGSGPGPGITTGPTGGGIIDQTTGTDGSSESAFVRASKQLSQRLNRMAAVTAKLAAEQLSSPDAAYKLSGMIYGVPFLIAVFFVVGMYREIKHIAVLRKTAEHEKQTAADKSHFLNLVAHHIRTPVTVINMAADLLKADITDPVLQGRFKQATADLQTISSAAVDKVLARAADAPVEEPVTAALDTKKLYLSPFFWMPVLFSIVATIVLNLLIKNIGHQNIASTAFLYQVVVGGSAVLFLYFALRQRVLKKRQAAALEQLLKRQQALDAAKNEFIRSIADDLAPEASVFSGLDTAVADIKSSYTHMFHDGVDRLNELVDTVTTLSSINTTTTQTDSVDINAVLQAAIDARQEQINGKNLKVRIAGDLVTIVQDKDLLTRIADTVIDNAIAFSPEQGTITIDSKLNGDQLELSIQDQGAGVPQQVIDNINEPFQHPGNELTETHQGLGLSLYLDNLIARHLGGSLRIRQPQHGTLVQVTIPASLA